MEFRKALKSDIDDIMKIIKQAQEYFKENKIDQWQNGYPNKQVITNDIENGYTYVLVKNNKITASAAIIFEEDVTYNKIYEGKWLSNDRYAVIHRIAVDNTYKGNGLFGEIIKNTEDLCINRNLFSIRIDTHEDNLSMQKAVEKNGFKYCGIIFLMDGNKRRAFEKLLNNT